MRSNFEEWKSRRETFKRRMEEKRVKMDEHKRSLAKEHGVEGHPKLDLLYQLAWDYGHASGYAEVEIHFAQLVPLIK